MTKRTTKTATARKVHKKATNTAAPSASRPTRKGRTARAQRPTGTDVLITELLKYPNVTILSREASKRLIENTEFHGCIARPKNSNNVL